MPTIKHIKKRNGDIVSFDAKKITAAIQKANLESTDETFSAHRLETLTHCVEKLIANQDTPGVEFIQDAVERLHIVPR